jgi:hypothetical protein
MTRGFDVKKKGTAKDQGPTRPTTSDMQKKITEKVNIGKKRTQV